MPLRIAIVGCGKIADAHAEQIGRIAGCELVAVCDREPLMARQLAERFGVARAFDDLDTLLSEGRPDVVHITTPPQSHFAIATRCLEHGSHVYVEKPFTLDAREAEKLVDSAQRRQLRLTVGHDAQFSPAARRMRALVQRGYLGPSIVHMESTYAYSLSDPTYARAFLRDRDHWVRTLPGGLVQNVMSHGIARIAEFLRGDSPRVTVHTFVSPFLRGLGGEDVLDEVRVIIVDEHHTTAYFTFSSQMRPGLNQFRVLGSRNGLVLDEKQQTVLMLRGAPFKSYVERFLPPVILAKQYLANALTNARLFLTNEFHVESGKRALIEAFYRSIVDGTPAPISAREILLTAKLMDAIVGQLASASRSAEETTSRQLEYERP